MTSRWLGIAAAAAATAALAPVTAAGQWSAAETVTPASVNGRFPDVAVNERGDAVAAWTSTGTSGRSRIRASVRRAGGDWEAPRTLSAGARSAREPRVAINAAGDIVATWRRVARTRRVNTGRGFAPQAVYVVQARRRSVAGTWRTVQSLSSSRQKSGAPRVGLDARGKAVVVWHWGTGTRPGAPGFVSRVQASVGRRGERFSAAQRLSRRGGCGQAVGLPDVAVGSSGQAVAWWECRRNRRDVALDYATVAGGGTRFGRNRRLPGVGRGGPDAAAAVASDGSVLLAFTRDDGSARGPRILSAQRRGATGPLGRPSSVRGARGDNLALADVAAGHSLVAWAGPRSRVRGVAPLAAASRAAAAAAFGPAERVRAPRRIGDVQATLSRDGAAAVAWVEGAGLRERVMATTRTDAARPWDGSRALSRRGEVDGVAPLATAADARGNVIAIWSRRDGARFRIERAEYRAPAGPAARRRP